MLVTHQNGRTIWGPERPFPSLGRETTSPEMTVMARIYKAQLYTFQNEYAGLLGF